MKKFLKKLVTTVAVLCTLGVASISGQNPGVGISQLGTVYYADKYGVKCDNSTDDHAALQALVDRITARTDRTGVIQLPAGTCVMSGSLRVGPSTTPWGVAPDAEPGIVDLAVTFSAPRQATFIYSAPNAAGNVTLSYSNTDLTSADVGNEVFYGTTDAAYAAYDSRVIVPSPTYACAITAVNTGTHTAACSKLGMHGTIEAADGSATDVPLLAVTGSHASWVTNDHDITVTDGNTLTADHVGKTYRFEMPVLKAVLNFVGQTRNAVATVPPGTRPCSMDDTSQTGGNTVGTSAGAWSALTTYASGDRVTSGGYLWLSQVGSNLNHTPPTYPTLSNSQWAFQDSWRCLNGGNQKRKYFTATITSVTDATHGKFQVQQLLSGSNWEGNFPDSTSPHGENIGTTVTYGNHEWCHGLTAALCLRDSNTHLDHSIDWDVLPVAYNDNIGSVDHTLEDETDIFPYSIPANTSPVHISIKGAGAYSTYLKWTGLGDEEQNAPAILISRNKNFQLEGFTLYNAETCGSGNCYDGTGVRVGMYFGGIPGSGTQTFFALGTQLEVAGFHKGVQLGDDLGGEMSDSFFNQLSVSHNDYGVITDPGSYNTLDIKLYNIGGGFNKIGVANFDGNLIVKDGTFSYNAIDFVSGGFGPFTIDGIRSEGPGRFLYGGEPNLSIKNIIVAEAQGSRPTTGTVTCTPSDVRTITLDIGTVSAALPANTYYPATYSSNALVQGDEGKSIVVAATEGTVVGYLDEALTATTGTFVHQYGPNMAAQSGKTAYIYDTDKCAMTWTSGQVVANDVGAAFLLPSGNTNSQYGGSVKVYIEQVTNATTGIGHWTVAQGGPVIHAGSSDVDPVLFDNIGIELTSGGVLASIDNISMGARIFQQDVNTGALRVSNSSVLTTPLVDANVLPVSMIVIGSSANWHQIDIDPTTMPSPLPTTLTSTGTQFASTLTGFTSTSRGAYKISGQNNRGLVYSGPTWPLMDVEAQVIRGVTNILSSKPLNAQGSETGHNDYDNRPTNPSQPVQQLGWVRSLGSTGVTGKNLRTTCKFATSATVSCVFARNENLTYDHLVGGFDNQFKEATFVVDSGHITVADLGKTICYPVPEHITGNITMCGWIASITDATHIRIRESVGQHSIVNGSITDFGPVTATVGENEPDANYTVFPSCNANETISWSSLLTTGFTLTSSNASSVARCNVLVIR